MNILVTGGAGYIGSHTTRLLLQSGHDVWVYDNLSRGHKEAVPADRLIVGELRDKTRLQKTLHNKHIDAIVHFAALTYVGESTKDPGEYYANNVGGSLSLLEAARSCGIQRIVFSSTAAVYGTPDRVPIVESDPKQPINPYGRTKLTVEQILADYAEAYGMGYVALRYFNAAGASPDGDIGEDHSPETHLIPLILQVALGQKPVIGVFGTKYPTDDGTCVRDYVHVDDLAQAHALAIEYISPGKGHAFNIGTGFGYSVLEVIEACRRVTGHLIPITFSEARSGDPAELVASPESAMEQLGWRPRYRDIHEIIETAWNWHKRHPSGFKSDKAIESHDTLLTNPLTAFS